MKEIDLGNQSSLYVHFDSDFSVSLHIGFPDLEPSYGVTYGAESLRSLIQTLEDIHAVISDGRPR